MAHDWPRLRRIFEAAIDLPPAERTAFLERECGADRDLRTEIEGLIEADSACESQSHILDTPPARPLGAEQPPGSLLGRVVGGFAVESILGSGGMGTVYAAVQEDPQRRVALKVMRRGLSDPGSLRRFRYESEVLGRLQHPGIAQVYAAGTHDLGDREALPFFALELIEGARDLHEHTRAARLTRRERLEIFVQVCRAVHYGHLKGVIHRDLKPANILVDPSGHAKIIDFGIARCTDADVEGVTMMTQAGLVLGTLQYMSPEQVSGRREDIDSRTDVYSLGVVLYQLLSEHLPYDLGGKSIPESARVICEADPIPLEVRDRSLRGDLSTILAKAMAKDRDRRYASAEDLGRDVERYLVDQPIEARAPSTLYQMRMFARRHTGLVVGGSLFLLVAVAGAITVSVQSLRIEAEARIAEGERHKAQVVSRFVGGILSQAQAVTGRGPEYTVREALDAAAGRIDRELVDQPAIEAEIRAVLGVTYTRLSLFDQAEPHLLRARDLADEIDDPGQRVVARIDLARLRHHQDRVAEAERLAEEAEVLGAGVLGAEDDRTLEASHDLAIYLAENQKFAAAEARMRAVLAVRTRLLGDTDPRSLATQFALGRLLLDDGQEEEAGERIDRVYRRRLADLGADHLETLIAQNAWGRVLRGRGDLTASETCHREAYQGLRQRLGDRHRETLDAAFQWVWTLLQRGELDQARPLAEKTLRGCEAVLTVDHQHTQKLLRAVGGLQMQGGEVDAGYQLMRRAYDASLRVKGEAHRDTVEIGGDLAFALHRRGDHPGSLDLVDRLLATEVGGQGRLGCIHRMLRGLCLTSLSRFDEAEQALVESLAAAEKSRGPNGYETRAVVVALVSLYEAADKPEELARYRARLAAIDLARKPR